MQKNVNYTWLKVIFVTFLPTPIWFWYRPVHLGNWVQIWCLEFQFESIKKLTKKSFYVKFN